MDLDNDNGYKHLLTSDEKLAAWAKMTEKMESEDQDRVQLCGREILEALQKHGMRLSEAGGVLGGVFGIIAAQTEENFPFVSFFNSFTRTYHANYEGKEPHHVSDELRPLQK